MSAILEDLFNSELFSDFTITTDDDSFKVHKNILALRSPFFKAMFGSDMKESRENRLELNSIDSEIVEKFLLYLYTSKIKFDKDPKIATNQAVELFKLAHRYQVPCLDVVCKEKMVEQYPAGFAVDINQPTTIFDLLNFAVTYELEKLREVILKSLVDDKQSITNWEGYREGIGSLSPKLGLDILQALAGCFQANPQSPVHFASSYHPLNPDEVETFARLKERDPIDFEHLLARADRSWVGW